MSLQQEVSLKECGSYEQGPLKEAIRELLIPLGGIALYVQPGHKVLLKPNLLASASAEKAVTTHPELIKAVIALVQECNPELIHIRDNPATESPQAVLKAAGGENFSSAEIMGFSDYRQVRLENGGAIKTFRMAHEVFEYDTVINLPKFKTHCQMTMTLGVKNWFGLVDFEERLRLHQRGGYEYTLFADLLIDLCLQRVPDLTILDAITGMEGYGPGSGGSPIDSKFIAASASPFALDVAAVKTAGHDPNVVPTVRRSRERGLVSEVRLVGDEIKLDPIALPEIREINLIGALPAGLHTFFKNILLARPVLTRKKCIHCKKCYEICPPNAISWSDEKCPEIDHRKCIRCYCCIEVCPQEALLPAQSHLKILGKILVPFFIIGVNCLSLIRKLKFEKKSK